MPNTFRMYMHIKLHCAVLLRSWIAGTLSLNFAILYNS